MTSPRKDVAMQRVLVIDDQPYVRAIVIAGLAARGFEVVGAATGAAGLELFEKSNFDLAIVDIYMPGLDGVHVIRKLRARRPGLPIIAMSGVELGKSGRTTLDFLPNAGLADIGQLKKPFRAAELISEVNRALSGATAEDPLIAGVN
jgi:DNA-binding response OmpR family regulator